MLNPRPYWNFDDPAASEAVFRELLETTTDEIDRVIVQTQIARALGLQGKLEEGIALIDTIPAFDEATVAWRAIELGRLYRSSGNVSSAQLQFIVAMTESDSYAEDGDDHEDPMLEFVHIDAMHMYALTLPTEDQIEITKAAIAKASNSNPIAMSWLPSLQNNLGMAYSELGDWQNAYVNFLSALEDAREFSDDGKVFIARYMVGWALRNLGRTDEALEWMTTLHEDLTAAGRSDEYVNAELAILRGESAAN